MNELMKMMDLYEKRFGDMFPTMCFQTDTNEEMIEKMNQCIKAGKPAKEFFGLDYSNEY